MLVHLPQICPECGPCPSEPYPEAAPGLTKAMRVLLEMTACNMFLAGKDISAAPEAFQDSQGWQ